MQLDTTRPWASRDRPPLYCEASRRGDGAAGDAARHVAAVGVKDRPPLCCEASRRRRWGCRRCCSTRRGHGRRGIDRCSGARRARGGDGAAGAAARRDATMGVVGSTAALLQSEQTAATELLVMRLDATRPWASRIDPCSGARRAGGGDGAAGDAARRDAAMGVLGPTAALLRGERAEAMALPVMQLDAARPCASWDRPLLCCEASRRRRGSCR